MPTGHCRETTGRGRPGPGRRAFANLCHWCGAPSAPPTAADPGLSRLACLALALATSCATAEVRSTRVENDGGRYRIAVSSFIAAPPPRVMALLTDFPRLQRLHPMVQSSETLARDGETARVRTTYLDCPLFILCMEFAQTSVFRRVAPHRLVAEADPAASDFTFGRFEWTALAAGGGTRLDFVAEVEPAFWIPPLIGDWVLERRLVEVASELQEAIEILALGGSLPPPRPERRNPRGADSPDG